MTWLNNLTYVLFGSTLTFTFFIWLMFYWYHNGLIGIYGNIKCYCKKIHGGVKE